MPIKSTYHGGGEVRVKVGNKSIKTSTGRKLTESLMNNIRETYNANTIGFFIADRSAEFN